MRTCVVTIVFLLYAVLSNAQIFQDVTDEWSIAALNASSMYGNGASAYDVNEDGWDDLTICIAGAPTRLYINNGGTFVLHTVFENIYDSKMCLWGDYDEDGDNDLFIIKRDGPSQLFLQTDSLNFVNQSQLLNFPFFSTFTSFGAALGDFNRDAYIDLFIANYGTPTSGGSKNTFLENNQNGTFSQTTYGYQRSSFQPVFVDLSKDLYQDIFIINDFRVGNELYNQTASGVFEDLTALGAWGLGGGSFLDAMSNSWCDFDNDADLDLYITNTPNFGNFLLVNNGANVFANEALARGVSLNKWCWSALWLDIQNDGWNDMIVSERHVSSFNTSDFGNYVLGNNQGQFSTVLNSGLSNLPYGFFTSAKGDFNNDGLYDVYLGAESANVSRVFENNSNPVNNFIKLRLKGRLSNRNGIGTHIDYFVNGEHRIHYTQSGENYLSQNSQNLIFGLGQSSVIDSLKLSWISGVVDTYYNIPVNTLHIFTEGETLPNIQASKEFLCSESGDSLLLSIEGWPIHIWNDGQETSSIWVYEPGTYTVSVGTGFGHSISLSYEVLALSNNNLTSIISNPNCFGESSGSIQIQENNTGEILFYQGDLTEGDYTFEVQVNEVCVIPFSVFLTEPQPLLVVIDSIKSSCYGQANGKVFLHVEGGTLPLQGFDGLSVNDEVSNLLSGFYDYSVSDANNCLATISYSVAEISPPSVNATVTHEDVFGLGSIDLEVLGNYPPYIATWQSGYIGLNYAELSQGNYAVSIMDTLGCVIDTSFTLLFNFIEDGSASSEFIFDYKTSQLKYVGTERLFGIEVYNSTGQLIFTKSSFGTNESVQLNVSPQTIFISSSRGNRRTKVVHR